MKQHKCILDGCTDFNIWVGGGETVLTCCECEKEKRIVKYQITIQGEIVGQNETP